MSFNYIVEKRRTLDIKHLLFEDDESTSITLAETDVVRFKMGRRDGVKPDLDLVSGVATANGSTITIEQRGPSPGAEVTVRFAQADTSGLVAGPYDAEIMVVDDSEIAPADAVKSAEFGTVHLLETMGGSVALN